MMYAFEAKSPVNHWGPLRQHKEANKTVIGSAHASQSGNTPTAGPTIWMVQP
jgi:hypothetical protein